MNRGHRIAAVIAALALTPFVSAQIVVTPDENARFNEMKAGQRPVLESNAAETKRNQDIIQKMARFHAGRLEKSVNDALGSSDALPVSQVVRDFAAIVVDPTAQIGSKFINEKQSDFTRAFGKEALAALEPFAKFTGTLNAQKTVLKINAGRMLAALARSGYEDVLTVAVDVVNDSTANDAVKLYYIQVIRNLFAVPNAERPEKSVVSKPEKELPAIQALIAFIHRKHSFSAATPQDEVDGYRYVRREALKALGMVRYPIFRVDNKVAAVPALVLLRFANMDKTISPPPTLSERVEGLIGYLQLNPDKEENMDFAAGFVAAVIRDLAVEYKARRIPPRSADLKEPPKEQFTERDYLPWKLVGTRLSVALKSWKDNWNDNLPPPRPADQKRLVDRVANLGEENVAKYLALGGMTDLVTVDSLNTLLRDEKFPSTRLFNEDQNSFIQRPEG